VGPRAGLDEGGISRPPPGFDPLAVQPVARCDIIFKETKKEGTIYYMVM
jgi:hypothetical protein